MAQTPAQTAKSRFRLGVYVFKDAEVVDFAAPYVSSRWRGATTPRSMTKGGNENIAALQAVMPLHTNLLHILSLRAGSRVGIVKVGDKSVPWTGNVKVFSKFSDLKGAKIAVVGSTQLLGQTLNRLTGHAMEFLIAESDDQAIKMLQANQVQALFTDGGWPLRLRLKPLDW